MLRQRQHVVEWRGWHPAALGGLAVRWTKPVPAPMGGTSLPDANACLRYTPLPPPPRSPFASTQSHQPKSVIMYHAHRPFLIAGLFKCFAQAIPDMNTRAESLRATAEQPEPDSIRRSKRLRLKHLCACIRRKLMHTSLERVFLIYTDRSTVFRPDATLEPGGRD
jgi:hypothetical protein